MSDKPSMWDGAITAKEMGKLEREYWENLRKTGDDPFSCFYRRISVLLEFQKVKARAA
jgi:hypothetical protein